MAAVRCAARRLGGSLLQRTRSAVTSPAVAEERRRLFFPRLVHTERFSIQNAHSTLDEARLEIERMKEVLYDRITKAEMLGATNSKNRQLLKSLSAQIKPRLSSKKKIKPRPRDPQWRKVRAWKRWGDAARTGRGIVGFLLCVLYWLECQAWDHHVKEKEAGTVNSEVDSAERVGSCLKEG